VRNPLQKTVKQMSEQGLLLEVRPSWWRFFWHLAFFWLIVPLIIALWRRSALVLRVYDDRVVVETGVLSKDIKEIFIADVRAIDVSQTFFQRIFKTGDIMVATAGIEGYEEVARGVPDPRGIKELIISQRRKSKGTDD
jgi:uncharacterized membrane protein YdbT with pleckstrin-like domain